MGEEEKKYKNKVLFLRKSKAGNHLYAYNNNEALRDANVLILNVSDVKALLEDRFKFIKISVLPIVEEEVEDVHTG